MSKSTQSQAQKASPWEELLRADVAHWKTVASQVSHDAVVARVVVQFLDAHPDLRAKRAGVYLAAKATEKRAQIRFAKFHRLGSHAAVVGRVAYTAGRAVLKLTIGAIRQVHKAASIRQSAVLAAQRPPVAAAQAEPVLADPVKVDLTFPVIVDPFAPKAAFTL